MVSSAAPTVFLWGLRRRARDLIAALGARIAEWADEEAARIGLWIPVALGAGAALYFLLKTEPSPFAAPLLAMAAAAIGWRWPARRTAPMLAAVFCAGFVAADLRTYIVAAPALTREISFVEVEGRLVAIDEAPKMRRLLIETTKIDDLPTDETPKKIRVSWRGKEFNALPGDLIRMRASLSPPPRPAAPGGFDFARQLYFQRIGAVGFAVSPPVAVPETHRPFVQQARAGIETMRVNLSRRIIASAPGDSGAIVAAVVTGKRGAISEEAQAAFRDAGLAHLLAISGLHMGLATGLIFFIVRALLALNETIALTMPIKKWAAGAALFSGVAYLMISGAAWSAQRALIMSSIFFIAIIADRRALSLRNVAIAAAVILILTPEAVLHPGFQMSFAAVTALIAAYEWSSRRLDPTRSFSAVARLRRYVLGIAATDTISAAATAPYSLYHFSRTANFGLAANIISIPLMGFWVMPAAIFALVLMPLGVDAPLWKLAAAGVDIMLSAARWTMDLPGSVSVFAHWPPAALGVLTLGGLWLCLMSAPWRLGGLAVLPVAAALIFANPHPAVFVSDDGDNAGVLFKTPEGESSFAVYDKRKGKFDTEVWMEQAGIDVRRVTPLRLADYAACDLRGCAAAIDGAWIAISGERSGFEDDCARADAVIALYPVAKPEREGCNALLIDRRDAWNSGAHALYVTRGRVRIVSATEQRGVRPWSKG
ncbi:MAG: ComEC/Rec2 family competence protein [Pseudomonadota bacterium]